MQYDQRIEKIAAVAVNVVKVLVIIYLGVEEVFKIRKSLKKKLDDYFAWADDDLRVHREWASQAYAMLKNYKRNKKKHSPRIDLKMRFNMS